MNAQHLLARHGEHAEGVVLAQVVLGGEGKLGEILERLQVVRVSACRIEGCAVVLDIGIGVRQASS